MSKSRVARQRRVVVTGMGAVTAVGSTLEASWEGLLAGACGIRPLSLFDPSAYRTQTAAEVPEIPDGFLTAFERRRMSRADRMGVAAAREAIANAGLDFAREDPTRMGVILGGGTSGLIDSEAFFELYLRGKKARPSKVLNHLPDSITDRVAQRFGLEGIKSTITTACSSSANAMGYALRRDRRGPGGRRPDGWIGRARPADLRRVQLAALGGPRPLPPLRPRAQGPLDRRSRRHHRLRGGRARAPPRRPGPRGVPAATASRPTRTT